MHARKDSSQAAGKLLVWMGVFFKGATNGELLCAVARDANNQMYPLAWAVVENENKDS